MLDSIENSPAVSPSLKQSGAPSLYAEPNAPSFPPFAEALSQTGRVAEADTLLDDDPSYGEGHSGPVQPEIILSAEDVYDGPTSNPPSPVSVLLVHLALIQFASLFFFLFLSFSFFL